MKKFLITFIMAMLFVSPALAGQSIGVYVKAMENAEGTFDETVSALEEGFKGAGFTVLASYESGVEEKCDLRAHSIVLNKADYTAKVISHGPTAAFALPLRVGVYEDESGTHVAYVNPASINRTVLGDDVETELSAEMAASLSAVITASVKGNAVNTHIGQIRDEGYVGGMGGGKFMKKVTDFYEGGTYADVLTRINEGIKGAELGWRLVYSIEPTEGVTLMGLTKPSTEAKAFSIAGDSRESKKLRCPGLDHAAAFPVGVVISSTEGKAKVQSLNEMYRMKLYFEDAGNWAFMKNMAMPGKIEKEIKKTVTLKLDK